MTWPDLANAGFEIIGGAMLWLTVAATHRAKRVIGVAIPTVLFFVAWDVWFLCFYWQLSQWASFVAGLWLTAAQATWLGQMVYYRPGNDCARSGHRLPSVYCECHCQCRKSARRKRRVR